MMPQEIDVRLHTFQDAFDTPFNSKIDSRCLTLCVLWDKDVDDFYSRRLKMRIESDDEISIIDDNSKLWPYVTTVHVDGEKMWNLMSSEGREDLQYESYKYAYFMVRIPHYEGNWDFSIVFEDFCHIIGGVSICNSNSYSILSK